MNKVLKIQLMIVTFLLLVLTLAFPDINVLLLAHLGNSLIAMTTAYYALVDEKTDKYFARICMAGTILFGFFVLTDVVFGRPFIASYLLLTLSRSMHLLSEDTTFIDQYVAGFNRFIQSLFIHPHHSTHDADQNQSRDH